eukprot:m.210645 g.210645  ORF g.210645 m.210645 type:complete len:81 (+) comp18565_c0_seq1:4880-5122(+)
MAANDEGTALAVGTAGAAQTSLSPPERRWRAREASTGELRAQQPQRPHTPTNERWATRQHGTCTDAASHEAHESVSVTMY